MKFTWTILKFAAMGFVVWFEWTLASSWTVDVATFNESAVELQRANGWSYGYAGSTSTNRININHS
jgi:hypothetical protein